METHFKNLKQILTYKCIRTLGDKFTLNICRNLYKLIKIYDKKTLINRKYCMLRTLIENDVSEYPWNILFDRSKHITKNSCGLDGLVLRYGEVVGNKLFNIRRIGVSVTEEKYTKTHTQNEWENLCEKKKSNLGKDGYIKKYGVIDGELRWNEYYKKWKCGIELKKKSGWKNGISLIEQQEKYGIEDGYNKWKYRIEKRNKTLSLNGFIERFGENDGVDRYKTHIKKMIENCRRISSVSKISQILFSEIYNQLTIDQRNKTYYHDLNKEQIFYIPIEESIKLIFVDFKCGKCILEFDGAYWHSFENTIKNDVKRDEYLKSSGYKILRIKEEDFKKQKNDTIKMCIEFIKKYEA